VDNRNAPIGGGTHLIAGRARLDRRLPGASIEDHQPAAVQTQTAQLVVELDQTLGQRIGAPVAPDLELDAERAIRTAPSASIAIPRSDRIVLALHPAGFRLPGIDPGQRLYAALSMGLQ